ncbi:HAMP domain-containing histidine kinase [Candidatus Saccharibacteria bacterium]|nr:HAMP domain-containing histidine kinase [Candidatus Saccharibacteria bacterium]
MAVNQPPKLASGFWSGFSKKIVSLMIFCQLLIFGLTMLTVIYIGKDDQTISLIIIGSGLIINLIVSLIIVISAIRPLKDLLGAVLHAAGEKTSIKPPNPNEKRYEKTGFRDALQTVYEMASNHGDIQAATVQPQIVTTDNQTIAIQPNSPTEVLAALDNTPCGFIVLDNERKVTYANKAAPVHTGTNGQLAVDLLFSEANTLLKWLDECEETAVHAENMWTRVPDRLPNEENRRFFDVIASYHKGAKAETVLTLIDRTGKYAVDEESLDFIAFAAHELRGPITVIRGYLDVLSDELSDVLRDDQTELFRRLIVSSNRLSGYINNILNTSRYDRRHLKVHLAEDTVANIYDTIKDDMQLRAGAQNRLLNVSIPTDLPTIAADRASLSEVFGNLIDNAIKYSNEGGVINVTAKLNGNFVDLSVEDHGIGMPESVVSQLFQKFYRSHRSRETVAGTGIGLYISKAIVESHGGNISVRSIDGHGSTFIVSLPIYSTVADKLKAGDNSNVNMINEGNGWIKNHSMYRG